MNPTSIELPTVYYASTADQGGLRPKPTLENDRNWPKAEVIGPQICTDLSSPFHPKAELTPAVPPISAYDPKQHWNTSNRNVGQSSMLFATLRTLELNSSPNHESMTSRSSGVRPLLRYTEKLSSQLW